MKSLSCWTDHVKSLFTIRLPDEILKILFGLDATKVTQLLAAFIRPRKITVLSSALEAYPATYLLTQCWFYRLDSQKGIDKLLKNRLVWLLMDMQDPII